MAHHGGTTRGVRRRRGLPTGRAVVGAFLVSSSAVGVFVAYAGASTGPASSYVVAARPVAVGERLADADLAVVALDLPPAQRRRAFTATGVVAGAVAIAPLEAGELVQASAVAKPDGGPGAAQLSFPVDAARALGGKVKPGERVDVIVTYGSGEDAHVRTIARDALLVRAETHGERLGSSGAVTIVVAVPTTSLEELAKAASAGQLTVARTTGSYANVGGRA